VLRTYRALLAVPGGLAFSAAAFVMRLPISMLGLGTVLLVVSSTGSYGMAGATAATVALTQAVCAPSLGRLVDRLGQARVMLPAVAAHGLGLAALLGAALGGGPTWTLFPAAALYGGTYPPAGSLVRARWAHAVAGTPLLATAYSVESILDEVIFIVGPVLVTALATGVSAAAGPLVAFSFAATGTVALARQRRTEPPRRQAGEPKHPSALRVPGLRVLVGMAAALGGLFGSLEIVVVAFASERGARPVAGLVLALIATGSMLSGLLYGAIRWRVPLRRRLLIGLAAMALAISSLGLAGTVPQLAVLAFVAGFAISPTLIAVFGLVEALVPAATRTEGLTWLTTGIGVGIALAAALVGRVIDAAGARPAFLLPIGCGLLAAVLALAGASRLRPAPEAVPAPAG
jgi:MFS family permease